MLLEELLEQEKREQGRQIGVGIDTSESLNLPGTPTTPQHWQQNPATSTTSNQVSKLW